MERLEKEWGDEKELLVLQRFLPLGEGDPPAYEAAASQLGWSLGAFKSRVLRFRQRFKELVETAVARTVSNPLDVAEELSHLQRVLLHEA